MGAGEVDVAGAELGEVLGVVDGVGVVVGCTVFVDVETEDVVVAGLVLDMLDDVAGVGVVSKSFFLSV